MNRLRLHLVKGPFAECRLAKCALARRHSANNMQIWKCNQLVKSKNSFTSNGHVTVFSLWKLFYCNFVQSSHPEVEQKSMHLYCSCRRTHFLSHWHITSHATVSHSTDATTNWNRKCVQNDFGSEHLEK